MGFAYTSDIEKLENKINEKLSSIRSDFEQKINHLSNEISHRTSDSEESAKNAAESTKQHEANAMASSQAIADIATAIKEIKDEVEKIRSKLTDEQDFLSTNNDKLHEKLNKSNDLFNNLTNAENTVSTILDQIQSDSEKIKQYLSESQELPTQVENIQTLIKQSNSSIASINDLLNHAITKKSEIDEIYKIIFGTDILNDEGNTEHTDGLKDQLDNSYKKITDNIKKLESNLSEITSNLTEKHQEKLQSQQDQFQEIVNESSATVASIEEQLQSLLPGAMAAGLSAAYENKKDEETNTLNRFEKNFKHSILGLVGVSLIPFTVDIYLLGVKNHELINVIKDTPSLIISILPLYFPILWLAYSSNKKVNLSKRLIEEYTHKAVLGKTFSGLSRQIDSLPHEGNIKEELRTKLLFSILQVSAENPGKLITDYQKSDHPLMEALEKSAKLSDAVESLSKIPGFSSLAKTLTEKAEQLLNNQEKKVSDGLTINSALEEREKLEQDSKEERPQT